VFELTGIKPRSVALFSVWSSRHDRLFANTDKLDAIRDQDTLHGHVVERSNAKLLLCNPPPRIEMFGAPPLPDSDDDEDGGGGCMGLLFGGEEKKKKKKKKEPDTTTASAKAPESAPTPDGKDKAEFEDEVEGAAGGSKSSLMDTCYVQFVHRRIDSAHETALFCQHVPRLFGWPLLLSFRVAEYNSEQMYGFDLFVLILLFLFL
jgi:hypothetical protein